MVVDKSLDRRPIPMSCVIINPKPFSNPANSWEKITQKWFKVVELKQIGFHLEQKEKEAKKL